MSLRKRTQRHFITVSILSMAFIFKLLSNEYNSRDVKTSGFIKMSFMAGMSILPLFTLPLVQWFLTGEARPPRGGLKKFPVGCEPLHAPQHGKFFNGNVYLPIVTPVRILRRYMLFGLVPEEMSGLGFLKFCRPNSSVHLRGETKGTV